MEEERSKQSVGKEEDAPRPWHSLTVEETARLLETSEEGLSDAEAAARGEAASIQVALDACAAIERGEDWLA